MLKSFKTWLSVFSFFVLGCASMSCKVKNGPDVELCSLDAKALVCKCYLKDGSGPIDISLEACDGRVVIPVDDFALLIDYCKKK